MSKLISLAYKSEAQNEIREETLIDILRVAREYNPSVGITGMLLYGEGKFFQTLEGDADAVHSLFNDKICKDERHHGVVVLAEKEIEEREFPTWAMGFQWTNGLQEEEFAMLNAGSNAHQIIGRIKEHMAENNVDMPL
ncbi:MAG: BLUF domain-containing protein [Verrucomicrobiota bacterium]